VATSIVSTPQLQAWHTEAHADALNVIAGVHPLDSGGRGAVILANAHAKALLMLLKQAPSIPSMPPKPEPRVPPLPTQCADRPCEDLPWGGRLFFTPNNMKLHGVASGDSACSASAPDGVLAKALMVDEHGCNGQPCRRASLTSQCSRGTSGAGCPKVGVGDGQIDWPLKPGHMYTRSDNTTVGFTLSNGLLSFPMFWFIASDWAHQHKYVLLENRNEEGLPPNAFGGR
jgi:hypothetical protein